MRLNWSIGHGNGNEVDRIGFDGLLHDQSSIGYDSAVGDDYARKGFDSNKPDLHNEF